MSTSEQVKTALLTEHFTYTPLTLVDDIINGVNDTMYECVNLASTSLAGIDKSDLGFNKPPDTPDEVFDAQVQNEIDEGIVKLESLLNATVDKTFDKLEIYTLRNLLTISNLKEDENLEDWIILDHYRDIDYKQVSQDVHTESPLTTLEALNELRARTRETDRLHRALRAEIARNTALLSKLRPLTSTSSVSQPETSHTTSTLTFGPSHDITTSSDLVKPNSSASDTNTPAQPNLGFLTSAHQVEHEGNEGKIGHLAESTKWTVDQLPALKKLLEEVRPYLGNIPRVKHDGEYTKSEREREGYVSEGVRHAVERSGVKVHKNDGHSGKIKGEFGPEGREVREEEVTALERVADTTY